MARGYRVSDGMPFCGHLVVSRPCELVQDHVEPYHAARLGTPTEEREYVEVFHPIRNPHFTVGDRRIVQHRELPSRNLRAWTPDDPTRVVIHTGPGPALPTRAYLAPSLRRFVREIGRSLRTGLTWDLLTHRAKCRRMATRIRQALDRGVFTPRERPERGAGLLYQTALGAHVEEGSDGPFTHTVSGDWDVFDGATAEAFAEAMTESVRPPRSVTLDDGTVHTEVPSWAEEPPAIDIHRCWRCQLRPVPDEDDLGLCDGCKIYLASL